jgi:hypothetical protein
MAAWKRDRTATRPAAAAAAGAPVATAITTVTLADLANLPSGPVPGPMPGHGNAQ